MKKEDVDDYICEFLRLKEEHKGKIELYMSMEIDYLGDCWNAANKYFF